MKNNQDTDEKHEDIYDLDQRAYKTRHDLEWPGVVSGEPTATATRHIGKLEMVSLGWSICNSWIGVLTTLIFIISQGGSPTLLYGLIVVFIMYGGIVYTMGELASVYPSAGGQYHWTAILAPASCARGLSYICGMINVFAWITIAAGVSIIMPQILLAMVSHYNPAYVPHAWHFFLIYQAMNVLCLLWNIFALRRTMWIFNVGFALSVATFITITATCLARAPTFRSTESVWVTFVNTSGWKNDGVAFLTGLLTPGYMYAGMDGAVHLAEESTDAARAVPRALLSTWIVGFTTSFIVSIAAMYTVQDFELVATTPTGFPIYELLIQATRSDAAATIFMVVMLVAAVFALLGCQQTASRLTWAFARDSGFIASSKLSKMSAALEAPIWALCCNACVVFIIGCIYLGSSTAFNAFIGTGLVLQLITFAFPAVLLLARGRPARFLPRVPAYGLPPFVGWIANGITVAFALLCLVFYDLPAVRPVHPSNMNYSVAVLAAMAIFAVANWALWARKHYSGPKTEFLEGL